MTYQELADDPEVRSQTSAMERQPASRVYLRQDEKDVMMERDKPGLDRLLLEVVRSTPMKGIDPGVSVQDRIEMVMSHSRKITVVAVVHRFVKEALSAGFHAEIISHFLGRDSSYVRCLINGGKRKK